MSENLHPTWPTTPFDRPLCPKCGGYRMALECIEPGLPDHDLRTFECPSCGHVEATVVRFR